MGWRIRKCQAVVARIARARPERITEQAAIQHAWTVDPLMDAAAVVEIQLSLHPGTRRQKDCSDIRGHVVIRVATVNQLKSPLENQGVYITTQVRESRVGGDGHHVGAGGWREVWRIQEEKQRLDAPALRAITPP